MKSATVTINLTREGHHVDVANVTPAELMLLVAEHKGNVADSPVVKGSIKDIVEVKRTNDEEVARLRTKYVKTKVNALFSGAIPSMPDSFEQAEKLGMSHEEIGTKLSAPAKA